MLPPGHRVVIPSLYEPFGIVALEALAAGRRWWPRPRRARGDPGRTEAACCSSRASRRPAPKRCRGLLDRAGPAAALPPGRPRPGGRRVHVGPGGGHPRHLRPRRRPPDRAPTLGVRVHRLRPTPSTCWSGALSNAGSVLGSRCSRRHYPRGHAALRSFTVRPRLPEPLAALERLAMNLRWSWDEQTRDLFRWVDPDGLGHHPPRPRAPARRGEAGAPRVARRRPRVPALPRPTSTPS